MGGPRSCHQGAECLKKTATGQIRQALGHTLRPPEQGRYVIVRGDGWGGGRGEYIATVTEADPATFTVVAVSGPEPWSERHVLRSHCIILRKEGSPRLETAA